MSTIDPYTDVARRRAQQGMSIEEFERANYDYLTGRDVGFCARREIIYPNLDEPIHSESIHSELDRLRELERLARKFADAGCNATHMSPVQFELYSQLRGFFHGGIVGRV